MRQEYFYEYEGNKKHEIIIRKFLLGTADTLRLTRIVTTEWKLPLTFVKHGTDNDQKFVQSVKKLQSSFVKKVVNHKRFNDISQGNKLFEHYFYRLITSLKQKINQNTLFWYEPPHTAGHFYCFEDPCFYRENKLIGAVISHEQCVVLYLMPNEKNKLEKKGIVFSK